MRALSLVPWSAALSPRALWIRSAATARSTVTAVLPAPHVGEAQDALFSPSAPALASLVSMPQLKALVAEAGFEKASRIQELSYARIFSGNDVIVGAETGSGKTLAYLLPLVDRHLSKQAEDPQGHRFGVILAPNGPLCDQIVSMSAPIVKGLRDLGLPLKMSRWADSLTNRKGGEEGQLSLIVCTPKTLLDGVRDVAVPEPDHPFRALSFVVLDEADMLLDGSYLRDMEGLLEKLKLVRRAQISDGLVKAHERTVQFVLSAATMPTFGLKSIDRYAKKAFPRATYIRSDHMHSHHPVIHQEFVKLGDMEKCGAEHAAEVLAHLQRLRGDGPEPAAMVFLNTAADAERFAASLRAAGAECVELHALLSKADREENLRRLRAGEAQLAVCTDACARGFDLPHVRRVVQADFALNVVQHLHRIGRAARGGRSGVAINFYAPWSQQLVDSVIGAAKLDYVPDETGAEGPDGADGEAPRTSIERSFSRRRGFRQRLKRAAQEGQRDQREQQGQQA